VSGNSLVHVFVWSGFSSPLKTLCTKELICLLQKHSELSWSAFCTQAYEWSEQTPSPTAKRRRRRRRHKPI